MLISQDNEGALSSKQGGRDKEEVQNFIGEVQNLIENKNMFGGYKLERISVRAGSEEVLHSALGNV